LFYSFAKGVHQELQNKENEDQQQRQRNRATSQKQPANNPMMQQTNQQLQKH
jgi:hypothetical protein